MKKAMRVILIIVFVFPFFMVKPEAAIKSVEVSLISTETILSGEVPYVGDSEIGDTFIDSSGNIWILEKDDPDTAPVMPIWKPIYTYSFLSLKCNLAIRNLKKRFR